MTVLVTGAGTGIGRHVALALARTGPVGLIGRRPEEPLRAVAAEIAEAGGSAVAAAADVRNRPSLREAVAAVTETFGPVDVLVNNAGYGGPRAALSTGRVDHWPDVLTTNLLGAVWATAEVLPGMVARGSGCVISMNSLQGSRTSPGYLAYGASKAALMRVTEGLAAEVAGTGVLVVDVSPGLVDTDMTRDPDFAAMVAGVPDLQWTPPERVAALVARVAAERPPALHGRFVHAEDDLDELLERLAEADGDARRLRLQPMRPDPLFD